MIENKLHKELRAYYNPDGSELRKLQLRMLEMLKYIDSICKENDIKYWLSSGTCLGAVRHGGFIPWDDDVDIEMMPSDFKKFCGVFKCLNSEKYELQTYETDHEYVLPFAKVRDKNSLIRESSGVDRWYMYKGAFVDVFPIYFSPFKSLSKIASGMQILLLHRMSKIQSHHLRRALIMINHGILYHLIFPVFGFINYLFKNNIVRMGGVGSPFMEKYNIDCVKELVDVEFEGERFPIPSDYDKYLSSLYGDYMEIPPAKSRQTHVGDKGVLNV